MSVEEVSKKVQDLTEKNQALLQEKKYYQLAQKIKLLGNRKLQSKSPSEASIIFQAGCQLLSNIPEADSNIPFELLTQLTNILIDQPTLLTKQRQQSLLNLIKIGGVDERKGNLIADVIRKSGGCKERVILSPFYADYCISKNKFAKVQKIVSSFNQTAVIDFINKWIADPQILSHEIPAIWSRSALNRGLAHNIDEAQSLLSLITTQFCSSNNDNQYFVFASLLIKSVNLRSKDAYNFIERSYEKFLDKDRAFRAIYEGYGRKYFGVEKKNGGIMSLLE